MKFGIFYEHQLPRPWRDGDEHRLLKEALEQVELADCLFVSQAGRNRHEHICESLELFAKDVMPEFHEREDRREREKQERLAPAIEAALARRAPPRDADPETVIRAAMKA